MKKSVYPVIVFVLLCSLFIFTAINSDLLYSASKPRLSAGAAKVNITPQEKYQSDGTADKTYRMMEYTMKYFPALLFLVMAQMKQRLYLLT